MSAFGKLCIDQTCLEAVVEIPDEYEPEEGSFARVLIYNVLVIGRLLKYVTVVASAWNGQ